MVLIEFFAIAHVIETPLSDDFPKHICYALMLNLALLWVINAHALVKQRCFKAPDSAWPLGFHDNPS